MGQPESVVGIFANFYFKEDTFFTGKQLKTGRGKDIAYQLDMIFHCYSVPVTDPDLQLRRGPA